MAFSRACPPVRAALIATILAMLAVLPASGGTALAQSAAGSGRPSTGLEPFRSDRELRAYLRRLEEQGIGGFGGGGAGEDSIVVTGTRIPVRITNTQEAGVDEGGIVKLHGDTLVILRRGRLFTVSMAGGALRPVDSINAFPPGVSGSGDWYDEMLVAGGQVIVIGYSYARGGTEINRFSISASGRLRFEDAWHVRSNDYFSSRNYASRLIGDRLIIYTPLYLEWNDDPLEALPGVRRWRGDNDERRFQRIAGARQIYKPPTGLRDRDVQIDTLHTVMSCDVTAPDLDCVATGVLGPASRTFYVSGEAIYLWTADDWFDDEDRGAPAYLYRLPLDRRRPAAVGVRGAPVDQFSFDEDEERGLINVVLRADGDGDAMWAPEVTDGDVALLRMPLREFGDGSREAPRSLYRPLPKVDGWDFHNRFVGGHLLYGVEEHDDRPDGATLVVAPLDGGPPAQLQLAHSVDRIEVLGQDGLVVGSGDDALGFTAIELDGRAPRVGDLFRLPEAAEGEERSHAFFFNPATPDGGSGMLGLPIAREAEPAYHRFFGSAAAMLFLNRDNRRFSPAGELGAEMQGVADDACQASCVDWYGNARPIFLGDRIFALLGYELVEGRLDGRTIRERRRVSFAPVAAQAEGN